MVDLILITTMLFVCGGIGLPLAELVPTPQFKWRLLTAPVLGFCALAVLAPVAYRWGATVPTIFSCASAVGAFVLGWRGPQLFRAARALPRRDRQIAMVAAAGVIVGMLMMIAPRWVGGDQFSVFQGNHWDTHGYLESAVIYAYRPYSTVAAANDDDILRNPLYYSAKQSLTNRPSAHLIYGVFSRVAPGKAYRLYYAYLVGCFTQFILVALFVVRNLLPEASPIAWTVVALVFPLGFWGQYVFDINAWSQIASAPPLLLMLALLLNGTVMAVPLDGAAARWFWFPAAIAVTTAGAVYLYPEAFLIYTFAVIPVAVAVPALRMVRARRLSLRPFMPLMGIGGAAFVLLYPPLFSFVLSQIAMISAEKVAWWQFFQVFFRGRDNVIGGPFSFATDFAAGLFGMYFATPVQDAADIAAIGQRVVIVLTIVALLLGLGLLVAGRTNLGGQAKLAPENRHLIAAWIGVCAMLLLPAIYLASDANYWPAGKAIAYASPVYMLLLALTCACGYEHRGLRPLRWIALAFVALQLGSGVARIAASNDRNGVHYAQPYPAIQNSELKTDIGWDFTGLETLLTPDMRVQIQPMNTWLEHQLMVFMWSRQIPFATVSPVVTGFGAGVNLGVLPPACEPDVDLKAASHAVILSFRDGRPDVHVNTGRVPREAAQ